MFEFLSFELIVHDSAGGVVFRVITWIITVIIGTVPALCPRCAKTPPYPVPNISFNFKDAMCQNVCATHGLQEGWVFCALHVV